MFSEWIQSIFIICLFLIFPTIDAFTGAMKDVQSNWAANRCNPIMMPFASMIAPKGSEVDTGDNFAFCVQTLMASFAPTILQPFSYLQNMSVDMMGSINDSLATSTEQSSFMTFSLSGIIGSIYGVFLNVIVEFNVIVIKLLDVQGKLTGIITSILYIMTVVQYAFESMWAGVPGAMIKAMGKK
jgi:hypothetical protein